MMSTYYYYVMSVDVSNIQLYVSMGLDLIKYCCILFTRICNV
jgi:hypothetical protein